MSPVSWGDIFTLPLGGDKIMELRQAGQRGIFPFGESWYSLGQSPYMFTTYYRDYESGNDYAQARHYISRLARFSSPELC